MSKISLNDAEIYYELHGKGHPLILISGYTCDHTFWLPILEQLSKTFQVLIFDNRGVGQTKDTAKVLSPQLLADDVIALSSALKLKKPHIIGHSMGGTIAQTIGSRYGDQINKLVILASPLKWRKAMLLGLQCHLTLREQEMDFDTLFNYILPWIFGEAFLQNEKAIEELKTILLNDPYPQSLEDQKRQFHILKQFQGTPHSIYSTTLIGYGKEDIITLSDEAKLLASKISKAQLIECNCAHEMIAEVPDDLAAILVQFLSN